jgi:uncharacterized membrane protein YraQ (UPF0718 family)
MQPFALITQVVGQVWGTLLHNWPFLAASILIAAAMKLYVKTDAVAGFLRRHQRGGVLVATAAAVGTPLCSCGTTAIVLGMMAGSMPWAPIIAFMVASPLTSPAELFYSAGLFGWPFAIAFFAASIVLGLAGGAAGALLDARGWLRNQSRFGGGEAACECQAVSAAAATPAGRIPARSASALPLPETWSFASTQEPALTLATTGANAVSSTCRDPFLPLFAVAPAACGCGAGTSGVIPLAPLPACSCSAAGEPLANAAVESERSREIRAGFDWRAYLAEVAATAQRLIPMFLGFAAIGYLINDLIPAAWITALFGSGHAYGVPLAATLGLPFYVNSEASLPLVRGMLNSGMSSGAALAFLITGAGTSIGAIAGAMTIARWRVIGLVIATLLLGAIICGLAYDALLVAPLF